MEKVEKLRIINGLVYSRDGFFEPGVVCAAGGRIVEESEYRRLPGREAVDDARGCYVIPGLTDIHLHGCMGSDCCDGTREAFETMARYELRRGIVAITPATMTVSEETLGQVCRAARGFRCRDGAELAGLYLEGPFISAGKRGAQNGAYIRPPDLALVERLQRLSGGLIRTVAVAPETRGAMDLIRALSGRLNLSLAHTEAGYETAREAIRCGARQVTHLYNAMTPFAHREPGVVGAAADDARCMAELICDGIHVHPVVVRATFRMFGDDRILLVSDSMRAAGMGDGEYELGGQKVTVRGKRAVLADGTVAGSVTDLMGCLRTAVREMGIPLESAVKCAASNPARAAGIDGDYGTLEAGNYASLVLLDRELAVRRVYHRGKPVGGAG